MSVVAHSRPDLLLKIFHPESRHYRDDGIYTLMFYIGKKPVTVTIDDRFMVDQNSKRHAFVRLVTSEDK